MALKRPPKKRQPLSLPTTVKRFSLHRKYGELPVSINLWTNRDIFFPKTDVRNSSWYVSVIAVRFPSDLRLQTLPLPQREDAGNRCDLPEKRAMARPVYPSRRSTGEKDSKNLLRHRIPSTSIDSQKPGVYNGTIRLAPTNSTILRPIPALWKPACGTKVHLVALLRDLLPPYDYVEKGRIRRKNGDEHDPFLICSIHTHDLHHPDGFLALLEPVLSGIEKYYLEACIDSTFVSSGVLCRKL
jgi:hypothetical protein